MVQKERESSVVFPMVIHGTKREREYCGTINGYKWYKKREECGISDGYKWHKKREYCGILVVIHGTKRENGVVFRWLYMAQKERGL